MMIISIIVFLAVVLVSVMGAIVYFVDLASVAIVVLPALALVLAALGGGAYGRGLKWALTHPGGQPAGGGAATRSLDLMGSISFWLGLLGLVIGMVLVLQNFTDPSQIGPGLAISILSLLYGSVLKLLHMVFVAKLGGAS